MTADIGGGTEDIRDSGISWFLSRGSVCIRDINRLEDLRRVVIGGKGEKEGGTERQLSRMRQRYLGRDV